MHQGEASEQSKRVVRTTTLERANAGQTQANKSVTRRVSARMKELIAVLEVLTDPAVKHLALDDLFFVVLSRIREIMMADNLAILLLTEDKRFLTVRAVLGLEEIVAGDVRIPLGRGFAGKIAAQRKPLVVQDLSTIEIITPILREQLSSLLGVPLIVEDSVIGVIHIGMKRRRIFTEMDVALFERVAQCLALAIERTLHDEAEHLARVEAARRTDQLEQHLAGLLSLTFPDAEHVLTFEESALIDAITKISALAIEHEHKTMERTQLMLVLQHLNTQLEQINRELEQTNKRQGSFISMVGHELRTALTSIQGFSELLCSGECNGDEIVDFATDIFHEALRLNRMITDLLDLERMKLGKMQLLLHPIDLNEVLAEAVERRRITASQHMFLFDADTTLPSFEADRDKLTQVIENLLSNAVKYSPQGGEIVVRSMREEQMAHVTIKDSGMGMPSDMLETIFIPYSRVETEKTHVIQGTGLGLPIVRQIVEMHEGRTWAESTLGHGSLFHFTLPFHHVNNAELR